MPVKHRFNKLHKSLRKTLKAFLNVLPIIIGMMFLVAVVLLYAVCYGIVTEKLLKS